VESCVGPVPVGSPIDTSTPGLHTFEVQARDVASNQTTTVASFVVIDACTVGLDNDGSNGSFGGYPSWIIDGILPEGASIGNDECDEDDDNSGCIDVIEPLLIPARDPLNPWDYADMWTPALMSSGSLVGGRDGVVTLNDASAVLAWVGAVNGGAPLPSGRDYDMDVNENVIEDGAEYDRTPGATQGRSGPPNGAVTLQDVMVVIDQAGDRCR
jgi:hypothetical protein